MISTSGDDESSMCPLLIDWYSNDNFRHVIKKFHAQDSNAMLLSNTSKLQVVYMSMFVEMSVTHDMTYEKMFWDSVVSRLLGTTMCISLKEVAALNDDETRIFFHIILLWIGSAVDACNNPIYRGRK